jgi:hypothetical protein
MLVIFQLISPSSISSFILLCLKLLFLSSFRPSVLHPTLGLKLNV